MRIHFVPLGIWVLAVTAASFLTNHPLLLAGLLAATVLVAWRTRAFATWASYMSLALWMGLLIVLVNPLFAPTGATVLWRGDFVLPVVGRLVLSVEAFAFAGAMFLRLATTLSAFAVLSHALDVDAMVSTLAARFRPAVVLPFALAVRFFPVVGRDARAVADVARSRGLELDRGSRLARARNAAHTLMPLLERSLDRSVSLAEAMEARGFGAGPRTRYAPRRFRGSDAIAAATASLPLLLVAIFATLGIDAFSYYPRLAAPALPSEALAAFAAVVVAFALVIREEAS